MKRLIQSLARWVLRVPSSVSELPAVPLVVEWTADDARQWKTFLQSPAGQSLWQRARARQAALCVEACDGKFDPKTAGGVSFTLNWLESLANAEAISSAALVKAANTETAPDEPQTFDPELVYSH